MRKVFCLVGCFVFVSVFGGICFFDTPVFAAQGGYLAGYDTLDPKPSTISWWSTFAYLISLLAVFLFVAVMAYFASKFLGGRFTKTAFSESGRVMAHVPLGPNRSVCVVELAERIFMLGVTEHSITLLREITDEEEIERLHRQSMMDLGRRDPFGDQFGSLEDLARRIPSLFKKGTDRR